MPRPRKAWISATSLGPQTTDHRLQTADRRPQTTVSGPPHGRPIPDAGHGSNPARGSRRLRFRLQRPPAHTDGPHALSVRPKTPGSTEHHPQDIPSLLSFACSHTGRRLDVRGSIYTLFSQSPEESQVWGCGRRSVGGGRQSSICGPRTADRRPQTAVGGRPSAVNIKYRKKPQSCQLLGTPATATGRSPKARPFRRQATSTPSGGRVKLGVGGPGVRG